MGNIIDGKAVAKKLREQIKKNVAELVDKRGIIPSLSVILVGDDPASVSYVRGKEKACIEAGIESTIHRLPATAREDELVALIASINNDPSVHGILVQLPLPKHINETNVLRQVLPSKDVDGLHPINMGRLFKGEDPLFIPCTPLGVVELILSTGIDMAGKKAVIVGRSNLVGKPVAILLLSRNATVTWCHSKTRDIGKETSSADILIAATGKPGLITANMVKPGAVVIDVGTTRVEKGLTGDVDFDNVKDVASYITPVPGGVGPMTITMLLQNVLASAKRLGSEGQGGMPEIQSIIT